MDKDTKKIKETEIKDNLKINTAIPSIFFIIIGIISITFSFTLDKFYLFILGIILIILAIFIWNFLYKRSLKKINEHYEGILKI